jgi:uncharacterized lipoprotein YajG
MLFMKITLTILLSGLLLCGCSQKQASSANSAIDLVQAGKDTVRPDGTVIHVTKRDGTSIEGVQITKTFADGQKSTISADTGTVQNELENNKVRLFLYHAKVETITQAGTNVMTIEKMPILL